MTATEPAVEALARALRMWDRLGGTWESASDRERADCMQEARALWATLKPLAVAGEREECAKVADWYHVESVKWAREQVWFTGDVRETDSSRIAAAIRERGQA